MKAFEHLVLPLIKVYNPDVIVFELGADGVPVLSVEAVGEAGGIGAALEVAFGFEVDGVLVEGDEGGFGG